MTDTPAPVAPVAEPAPRVIRFDPRKFELNKAGYITQEWVHTLTEDQTFDDCLDPNAYARVMGGNIKPKATRDTVIVFSHDGRDRKEFYVVALDKGWLKLQQISVAQGPVVKIAEASPLDLKWNVGARKYQVIRKNDNSVLKDGFQLKEDAARWMGEHLKQMAA